METNQDYRTFLVKNTSNIMNIYKHNCENETCLNKSSIYVESENKFKVHSDLKEKELLKLNLLKRLNTPLL